MNIPAIRAALDAVAIPHSSRTLGSEQAVESLEEGADGLTLVGWADTQHLDDAARDETHT